MGLPLPLWERIEVRGIRPHSFDKLRTGSNLPPEGEETRPSAIYGVVIES